MISQRKYKSDVLASVHEIMENLHEVDAIDKKTMREFDGACLEPMEAFTPEAIKDLRLQTRVSQAVFARHLNVTLGLLRQWERGEKRPSGPALKLLYSIAKYGIDGMI